MVTAKRERNRTFLQQKLSEISSFADNKSVSSLDSGTSGILASAAPKKRREQKRPDASRSISSVRRNPRRSASSVASYAEDDDSSLSSKSSSSYSEKSSSSDEDNICLADLGREHLPSTNTEKKRDDASHRSGSQTKPHGRPQKRRKLVTSTTEAHPYEVRIPQPESLFTSQTEYLPLKTPDQDTRIRGPNADNLLPLSDVRDMTAFLEHIVVDGFRIKSREFDWIDFSSGGSFAEGDGQNTMHLVDKRLYHGLDSDHVEDVKVESDEDDNLIPKEYRLSLQPTDKKSARIKDMDRLWIDEYGDGIDPIMYSDEYLASNDNGEAGRYTSLLMQRCWDRAVDAVSSTVTVDLNKKHSDGATDEADVKEKTDTDTDTSFLHLRSSVASTLHSKAMNVVDRILDFILSEHSSSIQKMPEQNQQVHWYDVCRSLQRTMVSNSTETNTAEQSMQPLTNNNGTMNPMITFDEATVKAITMRLVEMYGSANT